MLYKLLIVSPCFYPDAAPADLMVKSAQANSLKVMLYGIGRDFIPHGADAQVLKLWELLEFGQLAEYVLVTDCRDVLFLADTDEIVQKFEAYNSPLVMSAEKGLWPPAPELVEHFYNKDPNGYNFVNAGQYIAKWDFAKHCLRHLLDKYRGVHPGADNSQGWWMWAKMRGELDYVLDTKCEIFQSLSSGERMLFPHNIAGRVHNTATGSRPCSLHFNGNPSNDKPQQEMYRRLFA